MLKSNRGSSKLNYIIAKWAKQMSAEQSAPPENTRSSQQPMGPFLKQTAFLTNPDELKLPFISVISDHNAIKPKVNRKINNLQETTHGGRTICS